jgi:hypothetical protein
MLHGIAVLTSPHLNYLKISYQEAHPHNPEKYTYESGLDNFPAQPKLSGQDRIIRLYAGCAKNVSGTDKIAEILRPQFSTHRPSVLEITLSLAYFRNVMAPILQPELFSRLQSLINNSEWFFVLMKSHENREF